MRLTQRAAITVLGLAVWLAALTVYATNEVWQITVPLFEVRNAEPAAARADLEKISQKLDPSGKGIRILSYDPQSGVKENDSRMNISLRNFPLHAAVDWLADRETHKTYLLADVAICGQKRERWILVQVLFRCVDAKSGAFVHDVKVSDQMDSFHWRQHTREINGEKWIEWIGRVEIPFVVADESFTVVDSGTWEKKVCFRVSAPGYEERIVESRIFGDLNVGGGFLVEMQPKVSTTPNSSMPKP